MKHLSAFTFTFGLWISFSALAQSSTPAISVSGTPTTFLSIKFGRPITDSLPVCPSLNGMTPNIEAHDPINGGYLACVTGEDDSPIAVNVERIVPFKILTIHQLEGKVAFVSADFKTDRAAVILKALVEKYGTPSTDTQEPVQTNGGGKFQRHVLTWNRADITICFRSITSHVNEGMVYAVTPAYLAKMKADDAKTTAVYKNAF